MILPRHFVLYRLFTFLLVVGLGCATPKPAPPKEARLSSNPLADRWADVRITTAGIREFRILTCKAILAEQPICDICALAFCQRKEVASEPSCRGITLAPTLVRPTSSIPQDETPVSKRPYDPSHPQPQLIQGSEPPVRFRPY